MGIEEKTQQDNEMMERIFLAGIEEFKDSGVKFTMDSLAKRMGISKRTLYENISSKTALLEYVVDRTFADVKRQQHEVLREQGLSTMERLHKLLLIVPSYSNILDYRRIDELRVPYPDLYQKIQNNLESDWDPAMMLLQKAMAEGVIRHVNLIVLKLLLCEIFEQLLNGKVLIQNNISYEEAMQGMMDIVFEGILVHEKQGERGGKV